MFQRQFFNLFSKLEAQHIPPYMHHMPHVPPSAQPQHPGPGWHPAMPQYQAPQLQQMLHRAPTMSGPLGLLQSAIYRMQEKFMARTMAMILGDQYTNHSAYSAGMPFHTQAAQAENPHPHDPHMPFNATPEAHQAYGQPGTTGPVPPHPENAGGDGRHWQEFSFQGHPFIGTLHPEPDENGTRYGAAQSRQNGQKYHVEVNASQNFAQAYTEFSPRNAHGTHVRHVIDVNSGMNWIEAQNERKGLHVAGSNWSQPDANGISKRWRVNLDNGQAEVQHWPVNGPQPDPRVWNDPGQEKPPLPPILTKHDDGPEIEEVE